MVLLYGIYFPFQHLLMGSDESWVTLCSLFKTRTGAFVVKIFCWKTNKFSRQKFPGSLRHCCNRSVIQSPVTGKPSHLFYFTANFTCLQIILNLFTLPCVCDICSFSVGIGGLSGLSSLDQHCSCLSAKRASHPHHWERKMSLCT